MNDFSDQELKIAFAFWHANYLSKETDKSLLPFLDERLPSVNFKQGHSGWLKAAREGLFLSPGSVAEKLGISRTAYSKHERGEMIGTITLATLAKAAEAMDCELVYAIRPKSRKLFSRIIWEQLLAVSVKHPWLKKCDQRQRGRALAGIMNKNMLDPEFRRKQSWSQRANTRPD